MAQTGRRPTGALGGSPVSYTHLRAHETGRNLVCRLLLENGLKLEPNQMTRTAEMRVGEVMRDLNYERKRLRFGNKRVYEWFKREHVQLEIAADNLHNEW